MPIRLIAVTALVFCALGCGSTNSSTTADPPELTETDVEPELLTGMVTNAYADEGCPWLVQITTRGKEDFLIPIALDPVYLEHKKRIQFSYRPSRASSGNCGKGMPAILEDITSM